MARRECGTVGAANFGTSREKETAASAATGCYI